MERLAVLVAGIVTLATLAGCLGSDDEKKGGDAPIVPAKVFENGLLVQTFTSSAGETAIVKAAAGALSEITVSDDSTFWFPDNVLLYRNGIFMSNDGQFTGGATGFPERAPGETVFFLPPPGASNFTAHLLHFGEASGVDLLIETPYSASAEFVSGANAVHLERVQEDHFPHRTPGMPNYAASQRYFKEWFERHGYTVSIEPVVNDLPCAPFACASSIVNVVAYRQGTLTPERILAFGAHYDMVPQTTHAAFDDTSGTVEVLELARAFANVTTEHSLLFGLWGGEEDGLLGSDVWAHSNPHRVSLIKSYVNLDVSALAWPAPLPKPDPATSSSGPDGPLAQAMNGAMARAWAAAGFPEDMIEYREVGQGQTTGGGVDAQSDHTSFIAAGVPSTFVYTSNLTAAFALIHSEQDTLDNMTVFAGTGLLPQDKPDPLPPAEWAAAEDALAKSFATFQWVAFYYAVQTDLTGWDPRTA